MLSLALCVLAFVATWLTTRRDIVHGLTTLLAIGYVYGIARANVPQTFSHFIFDGAVAGLYLAVLYASGTHAERMRVAPLRPWMLLLIGWPLVLVLLPIQDPLVQLVGLRGAVFLVPFLLIGARLTDSDIMRLAYAVAVLNLAAFAVAVAEFFIGIEPFFPRNAVTELIYRSRDVAGATAYRIPSTFTSAHAYASTMATTCALLIGIWMQRVGGRRWLLAAAVVASIIGVTMAATRTHALILGAVMLVATISGSVRVSTRIAWALAVAVSLFVVARSERMQRFTTLQDTEFVTERVQGSVNENFLDLAQRYPMGVGLGGGGTSLPYFLLSRVRDQVMMENEYARIMLEQGLPGLFAWLAFIAWAFTRKAQSMATRLPVLARLLRLVCALYFASAMTGTGLLTAVPLTAALMLFLGWVTARPVPDGLPAPSLASGSEERPLMLAG